MRIRNFPTVSSRPARLAVALALAAPAAPALALPYGAYDAETQALGGASVAISSRYASLSNPALLATGRPTREVMVLAPSLYLRLVDPDDVNSSLDDFQDSARASAPRALSALRAMQDKEVEQDSGITVANVLYGADGNASLFINSYSLNTARANVAASDLTALGGGSLPATYASTLSVRGVSMIEAGVSFSERTKISAWNLGDVSVGLTPKVVIGRTHQSEDTMDTAKLRYLYSQGTTTARMNIDLGIAKELGNIWTFGATIRNLVPQRYKGTFEDVKTLPQLRAGAAFHARTYTLAADLDLTANKGIGFGADSQMVAVGAEWSAAPWLTLRGGGGFNLRDSDSSQLSLGAGLLLGYFRMDMAAMAGPNSVGAVLQTALEF